MFCNENGQEKDRYKNTSFIQKWKTINTQLHVKSEAVIAVLIKMSSAMLWHIDCYGIIWLLEPEYGCKIWYSNTLVNTSICKFRQCNIPKNWNLQKVNSNHLHLMDIDWTLFHISTFPQVVYVARNPKDVAVSFYHLNRLIRTQGYVGDFPCYWDYFEKNLRE